jgi:hypothetical protein
MVVMLAYGFRHVGVPTSRLGARTTQLFSVYTRKGQMQDEAGPVA